MISPYQGENVRGGTTRSDRSVPPFVPPRLRSDVSTRGGKLVHQTARAGVALRVQTDLNPPGAHRSGPSLRGEVRTAPTTRRDHFERPSPHRCPCRPSALRQGQPTAT